MIFKPNALEAVVIEHLAKQGYVVESTYPKIYKISTPDGGEIAGWILDEAVAWALCYQHFNDFPLTAND
jgi:hypothetical protein